MIFVSFFSKFLYIQTKFGARCKAWNLAPYNPEAPPCIRLRLEETIKPPKDVVNVGDKKAIQKLVSVLKEFLYLF